MGSIDFRHMCQCHVCVVFWFPAAAVFLCATFALFTMPEALSCLDLSNSVASFLHAGWRRRKEGGDKLNPRELHSLFLCNVKFWCSKGEG